MKFNFSIIWYYHLFLYNFCFFSVLLLCFLSSFFLISYRVLSHILIILHKKNFYRIHVWYIIKLNKTSFHHNVQNKDLYYPHPGEWIVPDLIEFYLPTESDGIPGNGPTPGSDGKTYFLNHEWISIWCQQNTRIIRLRWIPLVADIRFERSSTLGTRQSVRYPESHRISSVLLKSDWIPTGIR